MHYIYTRNRTAVRLILTSLLLIVICNPAMAKKEPTNPEIYAVTVNNDTGNIWIEGAKLDSNAPLLVTLGMLENLELGIVGNPGDITADCSMIDATLITCDFPGGLPDAGDYKLVVGTGEGKKFEFDEYDLTIGAVGPIGPQGIVGPVGSQGEVGPIGPQGEIGPIGPQGEIGPIGPQGEVGPIGPQGEVGPIGPQGEVGPIGPQGIQGVAGPIGATGATGAAGPTGGLGPQGVPGPQGPQGIQGPAGLGSAQLPAAPGGLPTTIILSPVGADTPFAVVVTHRVHFAQTNQQPFDADICRIDVSGTTVSAGMSVQFITSHDPSPSSSTGGDGWRFQPWFDTTDCSAIPNSNILDAELPLLNDINESTICTFHEDIIRNGTGLRDGWVCQ